MKLIFTLILHLACFSLFAQELNTIKNEWSFSFGIVENGMNKIPINQNLDFLNYFDTDPDYIDEFVFKMGYKCDFFSKMSADIKLIIMSDLAPNKYDVSVYYHFNDIVGIGLGSYLYGYLISYFDQFQSQSLPDYYSMEENTSFNAYDLGFYVTPIFKLIRNQRFQTTIKIDMGLSSFLKDKFVFNYKRKLSNEKLIYYYNTKITLCPFINSKLEMRLRMFNIKKVSFGLLLNSNLFYSYRNINYNRSIQQWTPDNEVNETIKQPKHNQIKFEADFGIYVKW